MIPSYTYLTSFEHTQVDQEVKITYGKYKQFNEKRPNGTLIVTDAWGEKGHIYSVPPIAAQELLEGITNTPIVRYRGKDPESGIYEFTFLTAVQDVYYVKKECNCGALKTGHPDMHFRWCRVNDKTDTGNDIHFED